MELLDPSSLSLIGQRETTQREVVFLLDEAARLIGALRRGNVTIAGDVTSLLPAALEDAAVSILLGRRTLYTRGERSVVDRSPEGLAEVRIQREALVHQVRGERAIGPRRRITEDTAVIGVIGEAVGAISLDIDLLTRSRVDTS